VRWGGHPTLHQYLSQTKRLIYEIRGGGDDQFEERLVIDPSEARYSFVYPFTKTPAVSEQYVTEPVISAKTFSLRIADTRPVFW
jgi:chlorite dismutase